MSELGAAVQGFQPWVGEHLEEPGASGVSSGAQLRERGVVVSEDDMDGGREGAEDETLPAEPLEPFDSGAGFLFSACASQGVGVDGGGNIEVRRTPREVMRQLSCLPGIAVEGEDYSSVKEGDFIFREQGEGAADALDAFAGLRSQVKRPGEAGMQGGRIRVQ